MYLSHFWDLFIHEIFPSDVIRLREVVDLLISLKDLVYLRFHGRAAPHDSPVFGLRVRGLPETVIFKRVTNDFHIALMKFEVVATVGWLERTDCYGVFIWPKYKKLLLKLSNYWFWRRFICCVIKLRGVSPSCRYQRWSRVFNRRMLFSFILIFLGKLSSYLNLLPNWATHVCICWCLWPASNHKLVSYVSPYPWSKLLLLKCTELWMRRRTERLWILLGRPSWLPGFFHFDNLIIQDYNSLLIENFIELKLHVLHLLLFLCDPSELHPCNFWVTILDGIWDDSILFAHAFLLPLQLITLLTELLQLGFEFLAHPHESQPTYIDFCRVLVWGLLHLLDSVSQVRQLILKANWLIIKLPQGFILYAFCRFRLFLREVVVVCLGISETL